MDVNAISMIRSAMTRRAALSLDDLLMTIFQPVNNDDDCVIVQSDAEHTLHVLLQYGYTSLTDA